MNPILNCIDLSKRYPSQKRYLFEGLNFSLSPKEGLHVLGPNGCGKTTLLRILCGLLHPDRGKIFFRDHEVSCFDSSWRRHLGWMPCDEVTYFPNATVFSNLQFWSQVYSLPPLDENKSALEWLERMELSPYLHKPLQTLSSGFRKRFSLVRALLHDPSVLVLDEPFAFLDREHCLLLTTLLNEWLDSNERVLIISSHVTVNGLAHFQTLELKPLSTKGMHDSRVSPDKNELGPPNPDQL